ncbi:MAG: hypothetical protein KME16_22555 [Scytolyngbya sp. HA4215-MV1]|jgi:hypothetical protein|nr:hypothetical protein [Scytolyngbya sp. HA4215-MV1]
MLGKLLQAAVITFLLSAIVEIQMPMGTRKPLLTHASHPTAISHRFSPIALAKVFFKD